MKRLLLSVFTLVFAQNLYSQAPSVIWQRAYGGTTEDFIERMFATPDGGYVLIGDGQSTDGDLQGANLHMGKWGDIWVLKLDANFNVVLSQLYGSTMVDEGKAVTELKDGGFAFVGLVGKADGDVVKTNPSRLWIVKLDNKGSIVWQKTYGGSGGESLSSKGAGSIKETSDKGFILTLNTSSTDLDVTGNHGNGDIWVLKLDQNGNIEWKKCYGGSGSEGTGNIHQTTDGGYILGGATGSNDGDVSGLIGKQDAWVVKLDKNGVIEWQKTYGGTENDGLRNIEQTTDGGYVFTGITNSSNGDVKKSFGGGDAWVVKLDNTGKVKWSQVLGGSKNDVAYDVVQTPGGGYAITGISTSNDNDFVGLHGTTQDIMAAELDANGNVKWAKLFGNSNYDFGMGIVPLANGEFVVGGTFESDDGDAKGINWHHSIGEPYDCWVFKLGTPPPSSVSPISITHANVYPTITNGTVHIRLPQPSNDCIIQLFNALGQKINFLQTETGDERLVFLSNIPAGMYLLQVSTASGAYTAKIYYQP